MSGESYRVRGYIKSDRAGVLGIIQRAFEYPWKAKTLDKFLKGGGRVMTVVRCATGERPEAIVGFVAYSANDDAIRLHLFAVRKQDRRKGVGRLMFSAVFSKLGRSRQFVVCSVRERNLDAQKFLRKMGLRATGVEPEKYARSQGETEDGFFFEFDITASETVIA